MPEMQQHLEDVMSAKAVIRMPGEGKEIAWPASRWCFW